VRAGAPLFDNTRCRITAAIQARLRGLMGFGKASRLHTAKILQLSIDLPLVIEIVDSEE
jgi:PII-like signaling protein